MTEEVTVSAASPVVDTKKTTTGATFTADVLEKIPTARDPWQIINMTPGVQAGLNVGGSSSGQQVGLSARAARRANVQWNLEGGSITDLSSNSSPSYFNFDSFEQIQVTNGGGDVSVQSSGLSINLVTKSGSNVFKGSAVGTFENDSDAGQQRHRRSCSTPGANGFLSGAPDQEDRQRTRSSTAVRSSRTGCGSGARPTTRTSTPASSTSSTPARAQFCADLIAAQQARHALPASITYDKLDDVAELPAATTRRSSRTCSGRSTTS